MHVVEKNENCLVIYITQYFLLFCIKKCSSFSYSKNVAVIFMTKIDLYETTNAFHYSLFPRAWMEKFWDWLYNAIVPHSLPRMPCGIRRLSFRRASHLHTIYIYSFSPGLAANTYQCRNQDTILYRFRNLLFSLFDILNVVAHFTLKNEMLLAYILKMRQSSSNLHRAIIANIISHTVAKLNGTHLLKYTKVRLRFTLLVIAQCFKLTI